MMFPHFSDKQWQKKNEAIAFAQKKLQADFVTADRDLLFSRDLWMECADYGVQKLAVPAEYGGEGALDFLSGMLVMEGLGYGCRDNGLCFSLNAQMWTVQLPIAEFGSDTLKERFLPNMAAGSIIGCHAITEPDHGSDAFSLQTRALKVAGGYKLTGIKKLISLAPVADLALVFATLDPVLKNWGITAFVVDLTSEGVDVKPSQAKMGLRTVPIGEIHFSECFVPEDHRVGPEGAGVSISNHSLEIERCSILASQLGAMERQLEENVERVGDRKQFGKSIGYFQSVSNRVADMKLRLETARLLLYQAAWLKSRGESAMMESALLKLHLSESFVMSSLDAIRNHGGDGYLCENEIERDLRDAIGGLLYAGTSDIQKQIIAGLLGLEVGP